MLLCIDQNQMFDTFSRCKEGSDKKYPNQAGIPQNLSPDISGSSIGKPQKRPCDQDKMGFPGLFAQIMVRESNIQRNRVCETVSTHDA